MRRRIAMEAGKTKKKKIRRWKRTNTELQRQIFINHERSGINFYSEKRIYATYDEEEGKTDDEERGAADDHATSKVDEGR